MNIKKPFKVMEASVQIEEFCTYQKACLFVEYLKPAQRMTTCSILEVPETKPLMDIISGR